MEPLLTERLILRPFSLENAKDIYELNGDPDVMKYTGDQPFGSIEEAREFISNYNHFEKWKRGRYGVFLREKNTFIGWCGLKYHEDTGKRIWVIVLKKHSGEKDMVLKRPAFV